jgi:four helix bundle protein
VLPESISNFKQIKTKQNNMATITRFEDLEIWQEARRLAKEIHFISIETELKKDFRFRDQIKAASGSVMDNIAEGFERNGNLEFRQFLSIAKGSAGETRSQLYRALDFNYINEEKFTILKIDYENLSGKINNFISYLNKKDFKGTKFQ